MWLRADIHAGPGVDVDQVASLLWDLGATGCEIRDAETSMTPRDDADITAYFPPETAIETLRELLTQFDDVALTDTSVVEDRAWAEGYQQYFEPTRVSERIAVRPPWDDQLPPGEFTAVVVIDPGMAFGTGTHETTRLCLRAIDDILLDRPDATVVDVGTGSGILSIAARQLGANVFGIDNDPDAVGVARDNWAANGLGSAADAPFSVETPADHPAEYDVVIANMLSGILLSIRDDLARLLAPGGILITSGVLVDEVPDFTAGFSDGGYHLISRTDMGEWTALRWSRP
jgi:ribosomal protein L11 methyltransferase